MALMVDRERFDLWHEMRERTERYLRATGPDHVKLGQCGRIILELGLDLEDQLVLTGRSIKVCDLTLAECVVKRLVDKRRRYSHPRGGITVDLDGQMRGCDLLVGSDVLELGHFLHLRLDDRRPMIELLGGRVRQRVLIERATQPPTNADVLTGLHVEFDTLDLGHLGS